MRRLRTFSVQVILLSLVCGCADPKTKDEVRIGNEKPKELDGASLDERVDPDPDSVDMTQALDVAVFNQGVVVDVLFLDASLSDASEVVEAVTISELTEDQWGALCTGLSLFPETIGATEDDLRFGYCVALYRTQTEDFFSVSSSDCGLAILECVEALTDEFSAPIGICEVSPLPPADCEITPIEFDGCIRRLVQHQAELSRVDVCAPTVETIATFNRLNALYRNALDCVSDMALDCQALEETR